MGNKTFENPSELFPYASGEFLGGINTYFNGEPRPTYPSAPDYKNGWDKGKELALQGYIKI